MQLRIANTRIKTLEAAVADSVAQVSHMPHMLYAEIEFSCEHLMCES